MPGVSQLLILTLAVIAVHGLHAECVLPEDVVIPDGTSATYEEMHDSQLFVKEYMAEMETYLECLDRENDDQPAGPAGEDEPMRARQRRTAIDAMETVAAKFNEQVRLFKETHP